jgi:hypothetical protein
VKKHSWLSTLGTLEKLSIRKGGGNWSVSLKEILYVAPRRVVSTRRKKHFPRASLQNKEAREAVLKEDKLRTATTLGEPAAHCVLLDYSFSSRN